MGTSSTTAGLGDFGNKYNAAEQHRTGTAAHVNRTEFDGLKEIRIPPNTGPIIDPKRPTPRAQPTPVERIYVG